MPVLNLTVTSLPVNDMAFTNAVYCHPDDSKKLIEEQQNHTNANRSFVEFRPKHAVFQLMTDPRVPSGSIATNSLQREYAELKQGFSTEVEQITPTIACKDALMIQISVELVSRYRVDTKENEFAEDFLTNFEGQVLHLRQEIPFTHSARTWKVTITDIQVCEEGKQEIDQKRKNLMVKADRAMVLGDTHVGIHCQPNRLVNFVKTTQEELIDGQWSFESMGIGGLDDEFASIFRRAFASRLCSPKLIESMNIQHVRGMLLYGPPGTGKTLIARQIGKSLRGKPPKVVNGPEILNKYVGQAEENIRNLFVDAEKDQRELGSRSPLHLIIFDEIDALCRSRGSTRDSTGVHDTIVNQLLSKLEGVESLNNILVIGMTNRKELIDEALLRPGRLEIHVEIGLPDERGRQQILNIHTKQMRESGHLGDVDIEKLAHETKNFSGAELVGLVKSAMSFAIVEQMNYDESDFKPQDESHVKVTMAHFNKALREVKPAFGVAQDNLSVCLRGRFIRYGPEFDRLYKTGQILTQQVERSSNTSLLTLLLEGPRGSGKTALAAKLALDSNFPFIQLISPESFIGMSETAKCLKINQVFEDAYRSPLSVIVLDNIERLVEYVAVGPRFSNTVLQTLLVLLKRAPKDEKHRLMVIGTTSSAVALESLQMNEAFNVCLNVPNLTKPEHVKQVLSDVQANVDEKDLDRVCKLCTPISMKQLLIIIEMARSVNDNITFEIFEECFHTCTIAARRGVVSDFM